MATSYKALVGGREREVIAATAGGPANANAIPALDASGKLTQDMMPTGVGPDAISLAAAEVLVAGAWVNITAAGTVRNASAGGIGTRAHGYVLSGAQSGAQVAVYFDDANSAVTGLTPGDQWLSTTPGQSQNTAPTGKDVISQRLGVAVTASYVHTNIGEPTILAQ